VLQRVPEPRCLKKEREPLARARYETISLIYELSSHEAARYDS